MKNLLILGAGTAGTMGQKIKTLVNEALPTGNYLVKWNATDENGIGVSSGVYIYVLRLAGQQATGKMIFQK